jgi:hypothetical protein
MKGCEDWQRRYLWPPSSIYLEGLRKTARLLSHESWEPSLGPPESDPCCEYCWSVGQHTPMHCGRLDLPTGTREGLDISFPEVRPNLPESSHTDIQFLPRNKYSPSPWRCCVWTKSPFTVRNAQMNIIHMQTTNKQTPWSESTSELYQLSDSRLSAKWLPTFANRGCHVVSMTYPYGRILDFLDRRCYFSIK